jgi:uncharacterized RDD family membrane protein YckC
VRLGAFVIDSVVVGIGSAVLILPLFFWFAANAQRIFPEAADPVTGEPTMSTGQAFAFIFGLYGVILVATLITRYVYQVELMFRSGQTLGKMIVNIAVVPLDPTQRLTRGMAAKRFLIETVATLFVPFLFYVDGLWQLWDEPFRQCLHDKFAQTVVIKR